MLKYTITILIFPVNQYFRCNNGTKGTISAIHTSVEVLLMICITVYMQLRTELYFCRLKKYVARFHAHGI